MSLANGRPYLAIPGPSVIPDQVIQAMMRPSPNIYEGDLIHLTDSLIPDLKMEAIVFTIISCRYSLTKIFAQFVRSLDNES